MEPIFWSMGFSSSFSCSAVKNRSTVFGICIILSTKVLCAERHRSSSGSLVFDTSSLPDAWRQYGWYSQNQEADDRIRRLYEEAHYLQNASAFEAGREKRGYSLLEYHLYTGRTHQIRVHMRHDSHPVVWRSTLHWISANLDLTGSFTLLACSVWELLTKCENLSLSLRYVCQKTCKSLRSQAICL